VATEAEFDQRAVRMHAEGAGLPAEAILKRYLPPVRSSWIGMIPTSVYICLSPLFSACSCMPQPMTWA